MAKEGEEEETEKDEEETAFLEPAEAGEVEGGTSGNSESDMIQRFCQMIGNEEQWGGAMT
jgi:hypothetical protein